jgi:uracil-DNA glycosylase family 4
VELVADRQRNPFGIQPPTDPPFDGDRGAVFGYGDPNADFLVIGDHPGVHGGAVGEEAARPDGGPADDGRDLPFTAQGTERLREVLAAVGLLDSAAPDARASNLFLSYIHPVTPPADREPTPEEYAAVERYFDAEFRAINPHVVLPVGERALTHVLREFTARAQRLDPDPVALHATEVPGRGHLVIPIREPADWTDRDAAALERRLRDVLARDYRQTSDLGRFFPGDDPYEVH